MDRKLEEYRARKQREIMLEKTKEKISGLFHFRKNKKDDEATEELLEVHGDEILEEDDDCDIKSDISTASDTLNCCTYKDLVFYGVCFILWAALYAVFIQLQFGIIYFIVSALIGMYLNTSTGKKKRNEISAYSVFNKNCESIDGTLKAEQLERQMIYGRLTNPGCATGWVRLQSNIYSSLMPKFTCLRHSNELSFHSKA